MALLYLTVIPDKKSRSDTITIVPNKTRSKLEKIQIKAWKYYKNWSKTGSYSPALKERISITRYGCNHLIDPQKRRTKVQKIKRLNALPFAKKIIESSTTYQEHRFKDGADYYAFVAESSGKRIKVIVSSKGKHKKKVFLSVIVLK